MIGCGHQMPTDCLRKVGPAQRYSMSCPIISRKRSSPTESRAAAFVGELLLSNFIILVKLLGVLGTFTYLYKFDDLKIFIVLGIFNLLGFVFVRNIVPYQKSVIVTHHYLAQRDFDIDVDFFVARGMNP